MYILYTLIYRLGLRSSSVSSNIPPVGTWCRNDVEPTSMRRNDVASMSVRRHFDVIYPLGRYIVLYLQLSSEFYSPQILTSQPHFATAEDPLLSLYFESRRRITRHFTIFCTCIRTERVRQLFIIFLILNEFSCGKVEKILN